jgi:hypothetical protein
MKTLKYLLLIILTLGVFASCSKDDDKSDPVNAKKTYSFC